MISPAIRDEALLMLEGKGAILDVARKVSAIVTSKGVDAAVIGGVAVVLHRHIRTTLDVDVWVADPLATISDALRDAGAAFDAAKREFVLNDVPIHFVTIDQTGFAPTHRIELENIKTVSLGDLISLKLSSGINNVLRSQDIADVIGLIRSNHLDGSFTPKIARAFRKDFKALLEAVAKGN